MSITKSLILSAQQIPFLEQLGPKGFTKHFIFYKKAQDSNVLTSGVVIP